MQWVHDGLSTRLLSTDKTTINVQRSTLTAISERERERRNIDI